MVLHCKQPWFLRFSGKEKSGFLVLRFPSNRLNCVTISIGLRDASEIIWCLLLRLPLCWPQWSQLGILCLGSLWMTRCVRRNLWRYRYDIGFRDRSKSQFMVESWVEEPRGMTVITACTVSCSWAIPSSRCCLCLFLKPLYWGMVDIVKAVCISSMRVDEFRSKNTPMRLLPQWRRYTYPSPPEVSFHPLFYFKRILSKCFFFLW